MLQYGDPVANANPQSAARTTFANHHANHGRPQTTHFEHALAADLRLTTLLRPHAGLGAGSINKTDQRQPIFFREPHFAHRLAISLRMRTTKVTSGTLLVSASFLMAHNHHFKAV